MNKKVEPNTKPIWKETPYQEYHFGHIISKLVEHPYGWSKIPLFSRDEKKDVRENI